MRRHPLIGAALGAAAFVAPGVALDLPGLDLARLSIFGAALGGAVAVDLAERRIPNRLVLPAAAVCALLSVSRGVRFEDLLAGVAVVALLLVFTLWRAESFGMGDVKLALLVVFGLNADAAQGLLFGLALAALLGALILIRYGRAAGKRALPLAPFFAAGSLLAFLA
jgi:leader peptidase (prepilin peptidase) / N-methyltransferase